MSAQQVEQALKCLQDAEAALQSARNALTGPEWKRFFEGIDAELERVNRIELALHRTLRRAHEPPPRPTAP